MNICTGSKLKPLKFCNDFGSLFMVLDLLRDDWSEKKKKRKIYIHLQHKKRENNSTNINWIQRGNKSSNNCALKFGWCLDVTQLPTEKKNIEENVPKDKNRKIHQKRVEKKSFFFSQRKNILWNYPLLSYMVFRFALYGGVLSKAEFFLFYGVTNKFRAHITLFYQNKK